MEDGASIVERTGFALVTRGELVVAEPDAQAVLARISEDALVLEFPVEIDVRIVPACDPDEHVDTTLARLTSALEAWA